MNHRLAVVLLSSLTPVIAAQERTVSTTKLGSGTVTLDYAPTDLKGRTPDKDLKAGELFRMSANEAAQLTSDVPLLFGSTVLPPGKHRLSARHDGKGKWEAIAFTGASIYADGLPHVVLPVKFAEEKEGPETLTVNASTDAGGGDTGTVKLLWGKFSLTLAPRALATTKVAGSIGGQPADFEFYGVPSTRDTHRCIQRGDMLRVGTAKQSGAAGLTFGIYGQRADTQSNAVNLVFVNEVLQAGKSAVEANTKTIAMVEEHIGQAPEERATRMKTYIEGLKKQNAEWQAKIAAAEKLPPKVEIKGDVQTGQKASSSLMVTSEKAEGGVTVKLALGQGAATFKVTEASFAK